MIFFNSEKNDSGLGPRKW